MNSLWETILRDNIKQGLAQLHESHQRRFKQMYAEGDLDMPIDEVVDRMPEDKLEWALKQVQSSIYILRGRGELP